MLSFADKKERGKHGLHYNCVHASRHPIMEFKYSFGFLSFRPDDFINLISSKKRTIKLLSITQYLLGFSRSFSYQRISVCESLFTLFSSYQQILNVLKFYLVLMLLTSLIRSLTVGAFFRLFGSRYPQLSYQLCFLRNSARANWIKMQMIPFRYRFMFASAEKKIFPSSSHIRFHLGM